MSKLRAEVRIFVDEREIHDGVVAVDTDDTGTPWMELMAGLVDVGRTAHDWADSEVTS